MGDPGTAKEQPGRKTWITPAWAERDSLRRRRLPVSWWHRAAAMASAARGAPANATPASLLVHTNSMEQARSTYATPPPGGSGGARPPAWDPRAVTIRGANTSVLAMLHELAFCCDALIVMLSALSSVAVLASTGAPGGAARAFGHVDVNQHFRMPFVRVPLCASKQDKHPECEGAAET